MGGIWVDSDSKTSMDSLYAVGETSCNGVHGKNRLASNSLLESLVFAKCAAKHIVNSTFAEEKTEWIGDIDLSVYEDEAGREAEYKKLVFDEMERIEK